MVSMKTASIATGFLSLLLVAGLMMLSVPIVDLLSGEPVSMSFLFFSMLYISVGFSGVMILTRFSSVREMGFLEAYIVSTASWLVIPSLAALPLMREINISFIDALFESISGFTGTGFTVLNDIDHLKKSINWWRALMQWSGELGFVVFAMVIIPFFWKFGYTLYGLERPVRVMRTLRSTARRIIEIYIVFTLAGIILLYYSGVDFYDAVVHTMTGIATGGMSNYSMNYEAVYDYAPFSIIPLIFIMVIGGMNFLALSQLLDFRFKDVLRSDEVKYYFISLCILSLLATLVFMLHNTGLAYSIVLGFFNTVSAMTTTGFNIGNIASFPNGVKIILVVAMIIGGMTFSTAGGIKVYRLIVLLRKLSSYSASTLLRERVSLHVVIDGKTLEEEEVSGALLIILLHLITTFLIASVTKIVLPSKDFLDAVFEAASATGCVGLSTGIISSSTPLLVKIALMTGMYLGKTEYLPLIVLTSYLIHRDVIKTFTS